MIARVRGRRQRAFSLVPRELAKAPAQYGLSVLETAVLLGILAAAHKRDRSERHEVAFKAAAKAMAESKLYQSSMRHAKKQARLAAFNEFHRRMDEQRKLRPPQVLRIDISRTRLAQFSGLSADTRNLQKIEQALDRYTVPVLPSKPPLLRKWTFLKSGRLRLHVETSWIEPRM